MDVLFHIDETERWGMALGNAANMVRYGQQTSRSFQIEVVANGPAVQALTPAGAERAGIARQLEQAAESVRICACNNALKANGIQPGQLYPFVQVVPAGVVELAERQAQGYAYIKP